MSGTAPRTGASGPAGLPELHLADWRATKDTLHLYCQIVGKIRLATTPPRNHWRPARSPAAKRRPACDRPGRGASPLP